MENIKLVIFDMDGTLIRNTDSVSLLYNTHDSDIQRMQEIDFDEDRV